MHLVELESRLVPASGFYATNMVFAGDAPGAFDSVRVTFTRQIDARSVDLNDVVRFTGPLGNDLSGALNGFSLVKTNKAQLDFFFDDQTAVGAYSITIGPGITDRTGQMMDQDGDGVAGEVPDDQFGGAGTLQLPVPPPVPPPVPTPVFTDYFDTGAPSPLWTQKGSGGNWLVTGDGVLSQTSFASGDPKKEVLSGLATSPAATITARVRVDAWVTGDGARAGVGVLTDSSGLGYNLLFRDGGKVQFLDDYVRWGNAYSFNWSVGVWYDFKLTYQNGTLLGKVWADGTAEPTDWMFTQAGWTTHQSGSVALNGGSSFTNNGSCVVSFDAVQVYDPQLPPLPPPVSPPPAAGFQIDLHLTGFTDSQAAIFRQAADRWQQVITGDLPDANFNGIPIDDLLIDANAFVIDGPGGILGSSSPDRLRPGTFLPYHGTMTFDSADMAAMEGNGLLLQVAEHEIGHVLGFGTIWTAKGLLDATTADPIFTGAQATAEYNARFGTHAAGVPVENTGGTGTALAHWRESILGNELMTGFIGAGFNPISRITIASLADLGYSVNLSAADPY